MKFNCALAAGLALVFSANANAQTFEAYQQRQSDLISLSSIFGELHHIRRHCEPRFEGDLWRNRMKKLIDLEEPQATAREKMVAGFNKGYRKAQKRFSTCDRRARDYAAGRAAQGDAIITRLTAPLYEAMAEDGDMPLVVRGNDRLQNQTGPN